MKKLITIIFTLTVAILLVSCNGKKVEIDKANIAEELKGIEYGKDLILEGVVKSSGKDETNHSGIKTLYEYEDIYTVTTDLKTIILGTSNDMKHNSEDYTNTKTMFYLLDNGKNYVSIDSKSEFGEFSTKIELPEGEDVDFEGIGSINTNIPKDINIDEFFKDEDFLKVVTEFNALKVSKQGNKLFVDLKITKDILLDNIELIKILADKYETGMSTEDIKEVIENAQVINLELSLVINNKQIQELNVKGEFKQIEEFLISEGGNGNRYENLVIIEIKTIKKMPTLPSFQDFTKELLVTE